MINIMIILLIAGLFPAIKTIIVIEAKVFISMMLHCWNLILFVISQTAVATTI